MNRNTPFGVLPETGFVNREKILEILPIGNTTLWRMIRDGRFPKAFQLSARRPVWRVEDVREWLKQYAGCAPAPKPPGRKRKYPQSSTPSDRQTATV